MLKKKIAEERKAKGEVVSEHEHEQTGAGAEDAEEPSSGD